MPLKEIRFAEKDPAKIESQVVTVAEKLMSVEGEAPLKLHRADPRRLMLLPFVAMLTQERNEIDFSAKMNLLAYARGDYLEHLGHFYGVSRLPAEPAATTLRFELSSVMPQTVVIPQGTRATPDGNRFFATVQAAEIPAGQSHADIVAACTVPGVAGNGWTEGQISQPVDRLPWVKTVSNITQSSGGADEEDDENLRARIRLAPESFSTAGPTLAYKFWAMTAHAGIVDVAVHSPEPGEVNVHPLMTGGEMPSREILDLVYGILSAEDIRPLTDYVRVLTPVPVAYDLHVRYWIDRARATEALAIKEKVEQAVLQYEYWQRTKLGRDQNPSELIHRMMTAGAKRVAVQTPVHKKIEVDEVSALNARNVVYEGLEHE